MTAPNAGETRDRQRPLKVWVNAAERARIEAQAEAAGLSVSAYLRNVGLGHQPRSVVDLDAVEQLIKVNADLGRLGGLLKLWLTDTPGRGAAVADVRELLGYIKDTQDELRHAMTRL
ncbi:conjugal transfer protein TraJ [Azospirillum sp. A1-3]|uniref:plasmid mobilization protein n=1 Tax=Azospirillum sp. A1-3 TaxID=185874 RepID=UPI0020774B2D|nr:conjugal transfer protein TraJ [Azospirillum sp. A1-3]MCM8735503.1 conjugal transfer protein TraJ [Azospirillum sp. A1-3]